MFKNTKSSFERLTPKLATDILRNCLISLLNFTTFSIQFYRSPYYVRSRIIIRTLTDTIRAYTPAVLDICLNISINMCGHVV